MQCNEFDARCQQLLDERRAPELDPALLDHARTCPNCRNQLATLNQLLGALDLLETPELPDDFAQKVVDSVAVAAPKPASPPKRDASIWIAAAIALTLLLAALPVVWQTLSRGPSVARQGTSEQMAGQTVENHPSSRQATSTDLGEGWLVSSTILELYPEATRQRHREQVHQIADDLRPIATPIKAAVTAIRRSIPGGKPQLKGEPRASINRSNDTLNLS